MLGENSYCRSRVCSLSSTDQFNLLVSFYFPGGSSASFFTFISYLNIPYCSFYCQASKLLIRLRAVH